MKKGLDILRKTYKRMTNAKKKELTEFIFEEAKIKEQEASDLIKNKINEGAPFLVSRLGTELFALLNYKEVHLKSYMKHFKYIKNELYYYKWDLGVMKMLCDNTGVFPLDIKSIERFAEITLKDMNEIDIWGQFYRIDELFKKELKNATKIRLVDIEPFIHRNPWSEALKDKKVLVIHPFEESIINQFKKREHLFEDKRVLPNFKLVTLKSVQTLAGNEEGFKDWEEALESMKNKINYIDFDIAIIGCGSYGLPLGAHIKRLNKMAVHIGGATQLLFGIIGARWEDHPNYKHFVNSYWSRPLMSELPKNYKKIENGCYW